MPKRATALTAASGEHYVAYVLSAMGFPVALTRGGSPTVDLLVGDLSGENAVSIQVKTSNWAYRFFKTKPKRNHWEWDVGKKALTLKGESIIYTFVDLKWDDHKIVKPDVFVVPSNVVANFLGKDWSRYMFWIMENERDKYLEAWTTITAKLNS